MIFLTVGTQFSFDRLVKEIDRLRGDGVIEDEVFGQIGESGYLPQNFDYVKSLDKESFDGYVRDCSAIISHAGMGSITAALDIMKPLLVMPRLKKYGEVVNNHQVGIARKFDELGHLMAVFSEDDLEDKIKQLDGFVPVTRKSNPEAVADRIKGFLDEINPTSASLRRAGCKD